MRVVPKLALALFAGVLLVVAAFTALRVRHEIEAFDADVRRDHRIVGGTAAAALARTRTREDAMRLARRVDATREQISVRFVSFASSPSAELRPLVTLSPAEEPAVGTWKQVVASPGPSGREADLLVTYVGAPVVDEPRGAIELTQPLASRTEYAWRGVWSGLTSSLAMLLVGAATVVLIGARVVGQPVSELIHATRRIAVGDFNVLESIQRKDEFGELAGALRSMSQELNAERMRTQREAEARIAALEQLRHVERLTTLGQLASVLAHEIGTPLNVIAGHGKLIASGRLPDEGIRESAVTIGEQSERITGIVRRVLDYARRKPPRRMWIAAPDVVQQACALVRGFAEQRHVELTFEPPTEALRLFADPDQLKQVMINLALNAIHASPTGGVVRFEVVGERSATSGGPDFVVFGVRDQGPGVPAEMRERVFEPFYTTKPAGEGTGLGLSIAADIVREHGGSISVVSTDEGASFMIRLPRGAEHAG